MAGKGKSPRTKMSPADRAKQFMPFAALKGYEDALRKKEKVIVPKIELSEEKKEELDISLHQIKTKDMVRVIYYHEGEYLEIKGMVSRLDIDARVLTVVHTKIFFENLYDLSLIAGGTTLEF